MDLDAVLLARIQFAFTVAFHIIFPSFTIGLAAFIATLLIRWRLTGREHLHRLARFWTKIFAVSFAMGVVSGGNINKIFKMAGKKEGRALSVGHLKYMKEYLETFTIEERIRQLGLNPDRADVIVPAAEIFLFILKHAGIKKIYVPKMGLADGIIRYLYHEGRNDPSSFLKEPVVG